MVFMLRPTRMERTEQHFNRDYELLVTISEFMVGTSYSNIRIGRNSMEVGEMTVFDIGNRITIEDESIIEILQELRTRGYNVIDKEDNTIIFQRWANRHMGWGMAFSIDGSIPTHRSVTITTLEPLSKPGWYFYISQ